MENSRDFYEFGDFRFDLRQRLLFRGGEVVPLPPKACELLLILLNNRGSIVGKQELLEKVWPGTFLEDSSLPQCISTLRKTLGHDEEFIETIPKRGYRFVAPPNVGAPLNVPVSFNGSAPIAEPAVSPPGRGRQVLWAGLIAVSLLIGGLTYGTMLRKQTLLRQVTNIRSIAVLPLANLSPDPAQEYFSDGLTDELITRLAQIGSLQVISRTSVMGYKQTRKRAPEIGQELRADALVEGTVEVVQDRVRIRVQVIRSAVDQHLWAATYDRDLKDVLQLETDLAREIAQNIGQITSGQRAQNERVRPVSPAAHENYLKGRYRWNQRSEAGLRAGIQYFQKAIELDPAYAQAYAGLADSYIMMANWGFMPASDAYPNAEAAARKALEFDDQLAEAHTSLAYATFLYRWDWAGAEKRFRRAIELNPNYATAHHFYSVYLMAEGRHQEAQREIKRAQELDPLSLIISSVVGWIYYEGRQYDLAIQQSQKTLEMDPNYVPALLDLGATYLKTGKYRQAIAQFERARTIIGDKGTVLCYLAGARALSGDKAEASRILRGLEKPSASSASMFVSPWDLALVHLALGDKERALSLLEKAVDQHVGWVVRLGVDPALDSLRAEPRFTKLRQLVLRGTGVNQPVGLNGTANLEAYQLELKGTFELSKQTPQSLDKSIEYYRQALARDPGFARPHAGIANSQIVQAFHSLVPPAAAMANAKAEAERALALNSDLASAHNSLGLVYSLFEHDWPKAEAAFRRAIDLDSLEAGYHEAYAIACLAPLGRFEEANVEMQRALILDPLGASVSNDAGLLLAYQGQFDRALAVHRQNTDLHPEFCSGYDSMALAHLHAGHPQEALAALEKGIALCGRSPRDVAMLTWVRAALRDSAGMKELLAEFTPLANARRVSPYLVAKVHMARSDRNTALDWLDIAIRERYPDSSFLKVDPAFAKLRSDPRFSGLVRKIGL